MSNEYDPITYEMLRFNANTGDALIFANTTLFSKLIRFGTQSYASHIGFVVRDFVNDCLYIMESTTITTVNGQKSGVQISLLSERLKTCGCPVFYRPLQGVVRDDKFTETFKTFRAEMKGKRYERNWVQLAASAVDFKWLNKLIDRPDLSSIFCSELYSEFLIRIGALPKYPYSNEYIPKEFTVEDDTVKWQNGVSLGNQFIIEC